jgi:hypothetical protein
MGAGPAITVNTYERLFTQSVQGAVFFDLNGSYRKEIVVPAKFWDMGGGAQTVPLSSLLDAAGKTRGSQALITAAQRRRYLSKVFSGARMGDGPSRHRCICHRRSTLRLYIPGCHGFERISAGAAGERIYRMYEDSPCAGTLVDRWSFTIQLSRKFFPGSI